EIAAGLGEELREPGTPAIGRELAELGGEAPGAGESCAQRSQDLVAGDAVELERAAAREVREALLEIGAEPRARDAGECGQGRVEPELVAVLADEVEDQARRLARVVAKPATELLQEQGGA